MNIKVWILTSAFLLYFHFSFCVVSHVKRITLNLGNNGPVLTSSFVCIVRNVATSSFNSLLIDIRWILHTMTFFCHFQLFHFIYIYTIRYLENYPNLIFWDQLSMAKTPKKCWPLYVSSLHLNYFSKHLPVDIGCRFGWLPSVPTSHPLHCWRWSKPSWPPGQKQARKKKKKRHGYIKMNLETSVTLQYKLSLKF